MSSDRILHIATDEKFINAANYIYEEAFPGRNSFFIIKPAGNPPLKHVEIKDHFKVFVRSSELTNQLLEAIENHWLVVFHGLNRDMVRVFNLSKDKEKFIWTFWGAEIYNSDLYNASLFGPKTKKIEKQIQKDTIIDYAKDIYRKIRYRAVTSNEDVDKIKALGEFRYIAKLNGDTSLFQSMGLIRDDCQSIPFTYYPLEFLFDDADKVVNGENILLGNSSSTTNNHVEMIDLLSGVDLGDRKVITPLSYGSKKYASIIRKYGYEKLGSSFYPLTEFLSLEEYHDLTRSCGIVIMNHYRPQGVGTSLASLYMGAKLFLNDTTFYNYLKGIGCDVYSIDKDLAENPKNALKRLIPSEIEQNRKRLREEISIDVVVDKLRTSVQKLFNLASQRN